MRESGVLIRDNFLDVLNKAERRGSDPFSKHPPGSRPRTVRKDRGEFGKTVIESEPRSRAPLKKNSIKPVWRRGGGEISGQRKGIYTARATGEEKLLFFRRSIS